MPFVQNRNKSLIFHAKTGEYDSSDRQFPGKQSFLAWRLTGNEVLVIGTIEFENVVRTPRKAITGILFEPRVLAGRYAADNASKPATRAIFMRTSHLVCDRMYTIGALICTIFLKQAFYDCRKY